jgi:hypothetical protein
MFMIAFRILLGVLKGAIVGGLLGGALWFLETGGDPHYTGTLVSWPLWPLYGVIGLLTGVISGRPPWAKDNVRGAAWVSSVFKGLIGFGFCVGLYFLGNWLTASIDLFGRAPTNWYFGFGAALGVIYAVFVEVDDSIGRKDDEAKGSPKAKTKAITPAKK